MSDPAPIVDEADLILAKLAKLDLSSAQHVHDCLMDTTAPDDVAKLAHAQARLSRSCRQTLSCLAKLKADREKAAREAEKHARWLAAGRPFVGDGPWKSDEDIAFETRAEHLSQAVGRVISHVAAGDRERHTELAHRLDRELDDWVEEPDFLDLELSAHVHQACRRLGLPAEAAERWDELPEPTFFPDPAPGAGNPASWSLSDDDPDAADHAPDPTAPWSDTG